MTQYSRATELRAQADELRRNGKMDEAAFLEAQARHLRKIEKFEIDRKEQQRLIEAICQPTKNLEWQIADKIGNHLIGYHKGIEMFEIKRGSALYSMNILHQPTQTRYEKNISTSTQLNRLKNKADKICKEYYIPFEK
jgi:hypothetical protein